MSFVTCKVCTRLVHVAATKQVAGETVCGNCIGRGYGRTRKPGRRPRPPKKIAPTRESKRSDAWR